MNKFKVVMWVTLLSKYSNWRIHYKPRNDEWIWDIFLKGMTLIFVIFIIGIVWILIKAVIDALKELE